jgi:hypothetical protein
MSKKETDITVYSEAKKLIQERKLDGNRMGLNDDMTNTNLISKNFSPLVIRKYNLVNGWPCWIGLIIDVSLEDLDLVVNDVYRACQDSGMICNNIQQMRNLTGILSESITNHYNKIKPNCVEGVAITLYTDKNYIQNFMGDFMNHLSCRNEYGFALSMLPHI